MSTRRLPPALAGLCLTTVLAAQGGQAPPEPTPSSAILLRLQSSRATLDTAREVTYELADRPITVRIQMFDLLARRFGEAAQRFDRDREKLQKRVARAVPQVQQLKLGKGGALEVETLRQKALAASRAEDLTKERIHAEIDPARARLEELLLVTPDEVLAHDDELAFAVDELAEQRDTLQGWSDLYQDTMRGLAADPAGARHLEGHARLPEPPPYGFFDADLARTCVTALPLSAQDQRTFAHNEALRPTMAEDEEYLGTLELNRIRVVLGLPALRIDPKLGDAARDHSRDMHRLGFFSHTSPVEGKRTPGDRAARFGTSGGAENIAAGQTTGAGAIEAWWYSPGHHKNMLGGHSRTGLGRCEGLWTQMFGG